MASGRLAPGSDKSLREGSTRLTSQNSGENTERDHVKLSDEEALGTNPEDELAATIAGLRDADIILYNGATYRQGADLLIVECTGRRRRKNVLLILVTHGGDADSAYRIARCLQNNYDRFTLYVSGYCKSAGTLIATGAHDIIMSDYGELGPLDVQMSKRDELSESQSGLAVQDTLTTLQHHALESFVGILLEIKRGSRGAVSLKMATEIATSMTTGLFAPIYGQVDPLHVGEAARAMNITYEYGERLLESGQNITRSDLRQIIVGYPSHGFVIDREEASQLFESVNRPSEDEDLLAKALGLAALLPVSQDDQEPPILQFLSPEPQDSEDTAEESHNTGGGNEQSADTPQHAATGTAQDADPKPAENGTHQQQNVEALHNAPGSQAGGGEP